MNGRLPIADDFWPLLDAACSDELSGDQWTELQTHLELNPAARQAFVDHIRLRSNIRQWWKGERSREAGLSRIEAELRGMVGFPTIDVSVGGTPVGGTPVGAAVELPRQLDVPSPLSFPFVGSPLFSYIAATLIVGMMLLGAWAYTITHDHVDHFVNDSRGQTAPGDSAPQPPELVFVGRVTGLKDCRWADPRTAAFLGASVPLKRNYALASGLMEITYATGAKVILEGPCAYEVESDAGGYLTLGKLTARVDVAKPQAAKTQAPRPKTQNQNPKSPSSLILHPSSLFAVRTPTAVVTDLGTEFGVEVDRQGCTESHVFQGEVEMRWTGAGSGKAGAARLLAGQTARCEPDKGVEVAATAGNTARFVRRIEVAPTYAERIVEKFDGDKIGVAFEQMPPESYANVRGAAVYRQPADDRESRGYIRTVESDFCDRDFTFEAAFEVRINAPPRVPNSPHHIFFGIGDGVPNPDYYDKVNVGLVLDFIIDEGRAYVRLCHPNTKNDGKSWDRNLGEVVPLGGFESGRHRLRMWKTGRRVGFEVETDFEEPSRKKYVGRAIDLSLDIPPMLDDSNSRLLIGAGNCDTVTIRFEELSIAHSGTNDRKRKETREDGAFSPDETETKGGAEETRARGK